jgi:acyl-CoA dehydrogenase
MRALFEVLSSLPDPTPMPSRDAWWARHSEIARAAPAPIDQAILGGFAADRLGYAFASGYEAALRALVPDLPADRIASLCVTERGGAHPRAVEAKLQPAPGGGYRLDGRKRWATLADRGGLLLVAASAGTDERGRNRLRLVRVEGAAPGVTLRPMPETPFVPEVHHGEIELASVAVAEGDILPGDGFEQYVRPFRTVEDVHLQAAILAYLVREVRLHGMAEGLLERLAALLVTLGALAAESPIRPEMHVALAGTFELIRAAIADVDRIWAKTESPAHARWERDRLLLTVAGEVRERRRQRAWERIAGSRIADDSSVG